MKFRVLIFCIALSLHLPVYACECVNAPSNVSAKDHVQYKLDNSSVVFTGKITSIDAKNDDTDIITFVKIPLGKLFNRQKLVPNNQSGANNWPFIG